MTRPAMPVEGQKGPAAPWTDIVNNAVWQVSDVADAAYDLARANQNNDKYGVAGLDTFAGSTDDAKLTAALSYAAAQTNIPAIQLPTTRRPTFSQTRVPFDGIKIIGGPGGNRNIELAGGKYVTSVINLQCGNGTSSWFVASQRVYNAYFANFGAQGGSQAQFWHQPLSTAPGLYSCRFESLNFDLMKHVFGTPSAPCAMTQVELAGHWTINNARDVQVTAAGSDNQFWFDGYLNIGTGQSPVLTGSGDVFYIVLAGVANSQIGFIYASGLNGWNCLKVTGSQSNGLDFYGGVYEGYKPSGTTAEGKTLAAPGNLVRIEGGSGNFFGGNFGQGMAAPPATHHGLIEVTAGEWNFWGPEFYRGSMAETTPCIYQSGGRVAVMAAKRRQSETWSGRPRFKTVGGTFDLWPASSMQAAA